MEHPIFLVPLDGSEQTEQALRHAVELMAPLPHKTLVLLTVVDPSFQDIPEEVREGMDIDDEDEIYETARATKAALERAAAIAAERDVPAVKWLKKGKPYDVIVACAEAADFLVMHQLHPSELREKLRGSMTERIARHAKCHVVLIREGLEVKRYTDEVVLESEE